jgi:putative ABC transport system permease protein
MSAEAGRLQLRDGLRVASVGLRARPLRAALSALGIAIGTAAIVGVLGLSSSSQAGLIAEINRLGTNLLTVEPDRASLERRHSCPAKHRPGSHSWTRSNWWHTPRW